MTDLPPVRCFTCGRVVASKLHQYWTLLRDDPGITERQACDRVGLSRDRYCCRGLFLCTMPPAAQDDPSNATLNELSPMVVFQSEQLRSAGPSAADTAAEAASSPLAPWSSTESDLSGASAVNITAPRRIRCI